MEAIYQLLFGLAEIILFFATIIVVILGFKIITWLADKAL